MAKPHAFRPRLLASTALLPLLALAMPALAQAPSGGQVVAGGAVIQQSANTTTINQSTNRAAIDWRTFNVGRDQSVQFNQPSAGSWTLNRVTTPDPSVIAGRVTANGGIAIVNQSGVVFAQGAQVNAGSLIASASNITNENFMAGRMVFDGAARPGARVENHGSVTVAERGLAALVGPGVANSGVIRGRLGRMVLAGAETFTLDMSGDGLISLDVTQSVRRGPDGGVALVTNSGTIDAAGGSVLLTADAARGVIDTAIRNTGRISVDAASGPAGQVAIRAQGGAVAIDSGSITATAAAARGGRVEVTSAEGAVRVAAPARIDVSGAAGGGTVQLGGAGTARVTVAGEVAARGNGAGARGGLVAVQSKDSVVVSGKLDASGAAGGGIVLAGTTGVGRDQAMAAETILTSSAELRADATQAGAGGTIAVNSSARSEVGGTLSARGGAAGGDGGFIEVSGQAALSIGARVLLDAPLGQVGTLLIDPVNILVTGNVPVAPGQQTGAVNGINLLATNGLSGDPTTLVISAATIEGLPGTVRLQASTDLTLDQSIAKVNGGLTLIAGSTIALGANNVSVSADFTATASTITGTGTVTVTNAGVISLRANTMSLTGALSAVGGTVEVGPRTAGAAVTAVIPNGGVTAATLRLGETSAGDRAFTDIAAAASGTVTGGALTVGAALNAATIPTLELVGSSIAVNAAVTAGTRIDLHATTGNITQTGVGVLTAAELRARATLGSVRLATAINALAGAGTPGILAGSAGGSFEFRNATALEVGTVLTTRGISTGIGRTIDLLVDTGDLTQTAAGVLTARFLRAQATTGSVALATASNALAGAASAPGIVAGRAGGDFALRNATALEVDTVAGTAGVTLGTGATIDLRTDAGNLTQTIDGVLTAGSLRARATTGSVLLATASNALAGPAAAPGVVAGTAGEASGSFALRNATALEVGTVAATAGINAGNTGTIDLTADAGNLTQTAFGMLTASALRARATTGSVLLASTSNALAGAAAPGTLAGTAGGVAASFAFRNATALQIGTVSTTAGIAPGAGRTIDLLVDAGNLTQTSAGVLTAGSLRAQATTGSVLLASATNQISDAVAGRATTAAQAFEFRNGQRLTVGTVAGTIGIEAGQRVSLAADDMAIDQGISAGTLVTLSPHTAGRHVALGRGINSEAVGSNELRLSALELSRITAPTLRIGAGPDASGLPVAGTITQYAQAINFSNLARPQRLELVASGAVAQRGRTGAQADEVLGDGPDGGFGGRGALTVATLSGSAGSAWFGADNDVGTLAGFAITGAGDFTLRRLTGGSLALTGLVGGASATGVTLITDGLSFGGAGTVLQADATTGMVELLPRTAGRAVSLGGGVTGLVVSAAGLQRIEAGTLRIGRSTNAAVTGNAAWPSDFGIGISETDGAAIGPRLAGNIAIAGDVRLRSRIGDDNSAVASTRVGRLELFAGIEGGATGAITQTAGSVIDVATLAGESRKAADLGSLVGTAAANRVNTLAGFRAGTAAATQAEAAFTLLSGSGLTVSGPVTAGLRGDGTTQQIGGSITLAGPSLTLNGDLLTAPAIGAVLDGGGLVRTDTSLVRLQATDGSITQSAANRIETGRLAARATGAIDLGSRTNEIHALVAMGTTPVGNIAETNAVNAVGGTVTLRSVNNNDATLAGTPGDAALVIAAPILAAAAVPTLEVDLLPTEADPAPTRSIQRNSSTSGVLLGVDDLNILATGGITARGGTIQIQSVADTSALGAFGAGIVLVEGTLHNGARPAGAGRFISVAEVARMNVSADAAAGDVIRPGITLVADSFTLGALDLTDLRDDGTAGNLMPGSGLRLVARTGGITQTDALTVDTLSASAVGDILLDRANAIGRIRDVRSTTGDVTLRIAPGTSLQIAGRAVDPATGGRGVEVSDGRAIVLLADNMDIRAPLIAPNGTVTLRPVTDGRGIVLGSAAADATRLHLSAAELVGVAPEPGTSRIRLGSDGTLRIGGVANDATGFTVAGGFAPTDLVPAAGDITLGTQALSFVTGQVNHLELFAGGSITQGTGVLTVGSLAGLAGGSAQFGTEATRVANLIDRIAVLGDTARFSTTRGGVNALPAVPTTAGFLTGYAAAAPANGRFSLTNAQALTVAGDVQTRGTSAPLSLVLSLGGVAIDSGVSLRAGTPPGGTEAYGRTTEARFGTGALRVIATGDITLAANATAIGTGLVTGTSLLQSRSGAVGLGDGAQLILGWGFPDALTPIPESGLLAGTTITLGANAEVNAYRVQSDGRLTVNSSAKLFAATDVLGTGGITLDGEVRAGRTVSAGVGQSISSTKIGSAPRTGELWAKRVERLESIGTVVVDNCICESQNISVDGPGFARQIDISGNLTLAQSFTVDGNITAGGTVTVESSARLTATDITAGLDVVNRGDIVASRLTAQTGKVENFGRIEGAQIQNSGIVTMVAATPDVRNRVVVANEIYNFNVISQNLTIRAGTDILNHSGATMAAESVLGTPASHAGRAFSNIVGPPTIVPSTLTLSTGSGAIRNEGTSGQLLASGSVRATAANGLFTEGDVIARNGDVALRAQQGLLSLADGAVEAANGLVSLTADAGAVTQGAGARILAARLSASAGGAIGLEGFDGTQTGAARGNSIARVEGLSSSGSDIALRLLERDTTLTGTVDAATQLRLRAERGLALQTATLRARAGAASIETGGALTATDSSLTAGTSASLTSGGALSLLRTTLTAQGGNATLSSGGALAMTGGSVTASQSASLTAFGAMDLNTTTLTAQGGTVALTANNGGAMSLTGTASNNTRINATGDATLVAGGAMRLDRVALNSSGGNATLTATRDLSATDSSISARDNVKLTGAGVTLARTVLDPLTILVVAQSGDLTATQVTARASDSITLRVDADGRQLRLIGGDYQADRILLLAGTNTGADATIGFSGTAFRIGTALLASAGGGIGQAGDAASTMAALDSAARPLVILDTRRGDKVLRTALPSAITDATRDQPGVEPQSQIWQVNSLRLRRGGNTKVFGQDDGSPAATNNAAGAVRLNLDADLNPVFLLVDGGTVSGALEAGRIGVHGVPASERVNGDRVLDLTGTLFNLGGTTAAQFGRVSVAQPTDQTLYRFNNCVLDTINCVATSLVQQFVIPAQNQIDIRIERPRLNPDAPIPNLAEEDY